MPEGQLIKVSGTNSEQIYLASHQMFAFNKAGEFPVNGRVVDLGGNLITSPQQPMEVVLEQTYGSGCIKS